jgi:hypothetical protein
MRFKQLISLTLASSMLAISIPQRANSSPAILAPLGGATLCAGTMGVACVAAGVVTVAGVTWAVWNAGNKKVLISPDSTRMRIADGEEWQDYVKERGDMTEDPQLHDMPKQVESMGTDKKDIAEARCLIEARDSGRVYVTVEKIGGIWHCVMKGRV